MSNCSFAIRWKFARRWKTAAALLLSSCLFHAHAAGQKPEDQPDGPALAPEAATKSFTVAGGLEWTQLLSEPTVRQPLFTTFDYRGRLWVVQYLQYPEPAGIRALSRDNFWRIVYDRLPKPPGQDVPGADRITIFEQKNGKYAEVGDFVAGLNIATSVAPTPDGAWVLNPPHLLFYRDADGDLKADGPPEVHLEGFGLEDTHSVVNNLCFGPDGWLYAAQGSTVTAAVKAYGSSEPPQKSLGQLIWRYHPTRRIYEVFAEGGGNAFGVAFDNEGRVYSGHNGGDTRGFHYVQGGYFRKGFNKHGSLSNPYSLGYLMPMQHDPIDRFTHTMLFAEGTSLEKSMPSAMLCADPLHGTLVHSKLISQGSTYRTEDVEMEVKTTDKWFRPVAINDGPDGAAYVCDWYDSQVAHLYAHVGRVDKDHGRVYRLAAPGTAIPGSAGASQLSLTDTQSRSLWDGTLVDRKDAESLTLLLDKLEHPYRWQRMHALQLLARHPLKEHARERLMARVKSSGPRALDALWALHLGGFIADTIPAADGATGLIEIADLLKVADPQVSVWSVRLACDDNDVSATTLNALLELAEKEADAQVISQLACSAKRLPTEKCLAIVAKLCDRDLPADDLHIPLLIWWAVEKNADQREAIDRHLLSLTNAWRQPIFRDVVAPRLIERGAMIGSDAAMSGTAQVLARIQSLDAGVKPAAAKSAVAGFERAFAGRSLLGVPDSVLDALSKLGQPSLALRLRRGDNEAQREAAAILTNAKSDASQRRQIARLFGEVPGAAALEPLLKVALDAKAPADLRASALASLAAYKDPNITTSVIGVWKEFSPDLRAAAGAMIVGKAAGVSAWLDAVEQGKVAAGDLPLEVVRTMRLRTEPELLDRINKHYPPIGKVDLPTAQKRAEELAAVITSGQGDPYRGKKLYKESCGRCHVLFDQGGQVGPPLTGYQRDQLKLLLVNVLGPSLEIREGFQAMSVLTGDGKLLSGFIERENPQQVVLRAIDGESHTIARDEIESIKPQPTSLMPEGLLDQLTPEQLRDLFAYLRSSQPLSDGT